MKKLNNINKSFSKEINVKTNKKILLKNKLNYPKV